jgi:hypothetical protein
VVLLHQEDHVLDRLIGGGHLAGERQGCDGEADSGSHTGRDAREPWAVRQEPGGKDAHGRTS